MVGTLQRRVFWIFPQAITLNFGPQHPSAHGVLRLILWLRGEAVLSVDPHVGLLHRGTEKFVELKPFMQSIPYFDRLDYVSMLSQEHAFVLSVEALLLLNVPTCVSLSRLLLVEMTRILNHIMCITTHALDLGALTPFLWGFEEREKLFEFYERVSGARMHVNLLRPGGEDLHFSTPLLEDIGAFCGQFLSRICEFEELLTSSRVWRQRLVSIGVFSLKGGLSHGFSGPMLRSCGFCWDLRKSMPYEGYCNFVFSVPISFRADSFDRYLLRLAEMRQSTFLILQCCHLLSSSSRRFVVAGSFPPLTGMEELITHFKVFSEGVNCTAGSSFSLTESPKGEFGVFLASDGFNVPFRCKIRSPGFSHLQGLQLLARGHFLADLVALIGTLDIVFGEVDR